MTSTKHFHRNHAAIDHELESLRKPRTPDEKFKIFQHVVEYWHGSIDASAAISHAELAGVRLPMPLKRLYAWAGRRLEFLNGACDVRSPSRLEDDGEHVLFYNEQQGVYEWATERDGDDPAVFGRLADDEEWTRQEMTLTEHLILAALMAGLESADRRVVEGCLSMDELAKIAEVIPPIPIAPWTWDGATRFYAGNGAFMYSMTNGKWHSVWLGAHTSGPLEFLRSLGAEKWDLFSL